MKKTNYILATVVASAFLVGCGSGSNTAYTPPVVMDVNTTYKVYTGDRITASEESELLIDHQYGNDYKTVTLISGSAKLFN